MPPEHALYWLWAAWYASWLISLLWAGKPSARVDLRKHAASQLATIAGVVLLFVLPATSYAAHILWHLDTTAGWIVFAATVSCFAFCWWARLTMGRLWSGMVSRLPDHHVIDTGPFAIVRHPIYSGIILAAFLLALEQGTAEGLAGAICLLLGLWLKARVEEEFLRQELGPEPYDAYRRRVPMLMPFGL